MTSDRIKEIQEETAYPESVSVMIALQQVWNECEQDQLKKLPSDEDANDEFNRLEQWCLDNDNKQPDLKSFLSGFRWLKSKLK